MRDFKNGFLFLFLLFFSLQGWAGSFMVYPVKIYLDSKKKSGEIRVYNPQKRSIYIQVGGYSWEQNKNGKPIYSEPKGLVFFPKMLKLEPKSERVIRIAYKGEKLKVERTYRIFVREIPVSKPGDKKITIALKIDLPVFVAPENIKRSFEIKDLKVESGKMSVDVKNSGSVHIMVKEISWRGFDRNQKETFHKNIRGWYILPGAKKRYVINIGSKECKRTTSLEVKVKTEKIEKSSIFSLPKKRVCSQ
ncbi:fimbrial biogenesis chaperone [Nitratiruptor tergarcus]|uniref:Fimbrial chaperone protein n=1 Tax=Nitratiruptor tergarcus DSM 16512 TaxID=1069081 RepID=A0A1W1WRH5_9BACT|nr:fimbria/pilus periplasmic chaperone [Nitratiruptor tergarcus]SMC08815.1 fimbrial chaperone protein [Nitratiruptor tergarcus DSM 16512]